MNLIVGIGVLLIGGVTLPSSEEATNPPDATQQMPVLPEAQPPLLPPEQTPAPPPYAYPTPAPQIPRPQPTIPLMPTDPGAGFGAFPWTAPTAPLNAPQSPPSQNFGTMPGGSSSAGYPGFLLPPTSPGPTTQSPLSFGRSGVTSPGRPFGSTLPFSTGVSSGSLSGFRPDYSYPGQLSPGVSPSVTTYTPGGAAHSPASSLNKPFAQYRPAPAISPYLNLFREENDFNRVDNYNTLVRPLVEQRDANLRVGGTLHGLQRNSRAHGAALQRIGGQIQARPGASNSRFMNYQGYFGQQR